MLDFLIFPIALLLRKPQGKLLFLLLGMILVLGPSNITFPKIFYFLSVFFLSITLTNRKRILMLQFTNESLLYLEFAKRTQILQILQLLIIVSTTTGALICGLPVFEILRGSVTSYLVFLGIPIAIYAGSFSNCAKILNILMLVGIFASASVAVYWGQRHGFWSLGFDRLGFDANFCAYLALSIALNYKFSDSASILLARISKILIPTFLIISLNRTDLLFLIWIYAIFILVNRRRFSRVFKMFYAAIFFSIIGVTERVNLELDQFPALRSRYGDSFIKLIPQVMNGSGLGNDQSLISRKLQGESALRAFARYPLFGQGVLPTNTFYDHFYGAFAILGLIGFSLVLFYLYKLIKVVTADKSDVALAQTTYIFFSVLIPATFVINWTSSKSLWIACLAITALSASSNSFFIKKKI